MAFIEIDTMDRKSNWDSQIKNAQAYYKINYLYEGKKDYSINSKSFTANANTFVLIAPNCLAMSEAVFFKQIHINFDRDYLNILSSDILNTCFNNLSIKINDENIEKFESLLNEIISEHETNITQDNLMLKLKLAELIVMLNRYSNNLPAEYSAPIKQNNFISNVANFIDANFATCTLENLSKQFYVSEAHLSREFKKNIGVNISIYIANKKIALASYLLKYTDESIETISEKCGMNSANYFGLKFKNIIGISPLQYRKANKK